MKRDSFKQWLADREAGAMKLPPTPENVALAKQFLLLKWQERAASNEPVYQFASKVSGKLYGRGLFISVNGFSPEVIRSLVMGKEIQTLFIDGEDLILALEGHFTLRDMIDRKVKAAQTKGLIYVHPISGAEKKS